MPGSTFIALIRFTEQGIKNIKHTCERAEQFKKTADKFGIQVKEVYWTLGGYDGVLIFEAPDEAAATAAMLGLGHSWNVQTETLRAFTTGDMKAILAKIPV